MRSGKSKGYGLLALFLITGAVIGGILGEFVAGSAALTGMAPYLVKNYQIIDVPPVAINLYVVKFIAGFSLQPNIMSIIGVIAAIFLFQRI
ncbi:DUF4321 domain-containing protein|uniref:DUF4321 domain-containing protein n=1 Tax=Dendrosporobacter quercicolus TaxID=146817 RepID=A0A1G9N2G9_9FIRM|nr:DUF4321 domain-containing protein [Dendrosporobacter quercicolus]NSL47205.1 DUF4321 domain-containing protein [Dendrosporobacter quercicolus DSM 1736]SDL80451.1 protein of unknown function [Dendrosporobacter quercicolus]